MSESGAMNRVLLILLLGIVLLARAHGALQTLLFVDDHDILYRPATKRVLHQPTRHAANPLLVGATIKHQVAYCSVYRDPDTGRYQMWYQITGGGIFVGYAESADGLIWTKPDAVPLTGDDLRHAATWKNATLAQLPKGEVSIRIHLENAEVFALTIE